MGWRLEQFLGNNHINSKVKTRARLEAELLTNRVPNTPFVLLVMETRVRDEVIGSGVESELYALPCYLGIACSSQY